MDAVELPWGARCAAAAFFVFSLWVAALGVVLLLLRRWPWCGCHVCRAYLTGSWRREFTNLSDWYADLLRRSPTGTVHVHVLGCTVTANPANVEYMLKTRFDNFPKGKPFAVLLGDLLGHGIFNVDGDAWRHQRKMASLELGSVAVRSYAYKIVGQEVETRLMPVLADAADSGAVLDLQDVFRRFAFDTICKISFGLDPGCLDREMPVSELADAFDAASRLSAMRGAAASPLLWKMKRFLNIGSERELKKAIKLIDGLAAAMIRERRKLGVANSHDLLSRFMASSGNDVRSADDDARSAADDKFLRDIVVSFLLAGRDTVSSALTTLFMILSKNPDVAVAMRAEARIWGADCDAFRPERWLTGAGGTFVPESLYKYPVFQAGLRVCLGKELAITEMKAVSVAVVRAFDVEVVGENGRSGGAASAAPRFVPGLTASISGGLPVKIRRV
uniref:Cytochrome P450 n=1 Tax=Oryza punctata TaxID=4537 RepID=A0A0E0MJN4_ORYPU